MVVGKHNGPTAGYEQNSRHSGRKLGLLSPSSIILLAIRATTIDKFAMAHSGVTVASHGEDTYINATIVCIIKAQPRTWPPLTNTLRSRQFEDVIGVLKIQVKTK